MRIGTDRVVEVFTEHRREDEVGLGVVFLGAQHLLEVATRGEAVVETHPDGRHEEAQPPRLRVPLEVRLGVRHRGPEARRGHAHLQQQREHALFGHAAGGARREVLLGAHEVAAARERDALVEELPPLHVVHRVVVGGRPERVAGARAAREAEAQQQRRRPSRRWEGATHSGVYIPAGRGACSATWRSSPRGRRPEGRGAKVAR